MKLNKRFVAMLLTTQLVFSSLTVPVFVQAATLDEINNAQSSTISAAMDTYLSGTKFYEAYSLLPECDKTEIGNEILKGISYDDEDAFNTAYVNAVKKVTQFDRETYAEVLVEGFKDGLDANGWTSKDLRKKAVGTGKADGIGIDRETLDITGEEKASAFLVGGSLNQKTANAPNYIEKSVSNPKSIITFYVKDLNNDRTTIGVQFNEKQALSTYAGTTFNAIEDVSKWTSAQSGLGSCVDASNKPKWTKIRLDGISESGKVKAYIDGELCYTFTGEIDRVRIGQLCTNSGYMVASVDNISIASYKVGKDVIEKFNKEDAGEDSLLKILSYGTVSTAVYSLLPESDRKEIAKRVHLGKPFDNITQIEECYQKALEYTTQADWSVYYKALLEDFSSNSLSTNGWTSVDLRSGAVGSGKMDGIGIERETLNISGKENSSVIICGGGLNQVNAGKRSYITKKLSNPKSIITLYAKDLNNDKKYIDVKFNDKQGISTLSFNKFFAVTDFDSRTVASDDGFGSAIDEQNNAKWTKIRFDGISENGKVKAYIDNELIYTFTGEIDQVTIGQLFDDSSFMVASFDNISVASMHIPVAKNVGIKDNGSSIEAKYDYSHTNGEQEGKTKFQWYAKNEQGDFEKIDGATEQKYAFKMPEDSQRTFRVAVTPVDKSGNEGEIVTSAEFTESYLTGLMPTVTSATISGAAKFDSVMTASYTALNATDSNKDRYRWYESEDGTTWTLIQGADQKTYKLGIDQIKKQIKAEVSVAGTEGSYSVWCESNAVSDQTTMIEMINALQSTQYSGKNAKMLELLAKFDAAYATYTKNVQQKIAVKVLASSINSQNDYDEIVKNILDGSIDVDISDIDFEKKVNVVQTVPGKDSLYSGFVDLNDAAWAKDAVLSLSAMGILSGKSDVLFCPNDNITRAEFVAMIVNAFYQINNSAKHSFTDVKSGSWYESYVATAFQNGLVFGKSDKSFGPDEPITREEMAVICARVIAAGKCNPQVVREYSMFDDETSISEYAYDSVVAMYTKGIMSGLGENTFGAQKLSTRAMAAMMVYIMLGKPSTAGDSAENAVTIEDFEDNKWIFTNGYSENDKVRALSRGNIAYSGSGSASIKGLSAAWADVGENKFFRIMIYDPIGDANGTDSVMMIETDNGKYGIGASTGSGALNQGLYYQCYAVDTWYETGVIKSVGWHEFIIDFSDGVNVDMYMDGMKVKSFKNGSTVLESVVIGNTDESAAAKYKCYADDFVMAKSKKIYENAMKRSTVSGNVSVTKADTADLPENLTEKAGVLNALNILSADMLKNLDTAVTREEFAYVLSCMQNESASHIQATKQYFTDVKTDSATAGYIESAVDGGFVSAESMTFRPQEATERIFALKSMLKLLGYAELAEINDDTWVVETAARIGLADGVSGVKTLNRRDMINLLWNTLNATVLNTNLTQKPVFTTTDVKYMNYKFDVYKISEYVNATYFLDITREANLLSDEMLIGNIKVNTLGKNVNEYVGTKVNAYIYADSDDDEYTLMYIQPKSESDTITISSHDALGFSDGVFRYEENERRKTLDTSKELTVMKNGAYLFDYKETDFVPDIGYIRFVDGDSDGKYEIAVIMDYAAVNVQGYNPTDKILYDSYTGKGLDLSNTETISCNGGGQVYPELLTVGSVVLVAISKDGEMADIIEDTETISGYIASRDGDEIIIDGKSYFVAKSFAKWVEEKRVSCLGVGNDGEYIIDVFGNIIGANTSANITASEGYAYIVKTLRDTSDDKVYVKFYTDSGRFIKVECAEKVIINKERCIPDAVVSLDSQLVKYKLNGDGQLSKLVLADVSHKNSDELKGSDEFWLYRESTDWYRSTYNFGSAMYVSKTPVMVVPNAGNEDDSDIYRMTDSDSYFGDSTNYTYKAYCADEFNRPEIILVYSSTGDEIALGKNVVQTRMLVVKSVRSEVDESGDVRQIVRGWLDGKEVAYKVKEGVDMNQLKRDRGYSSDWKFGDMFIPVTNEKDEVWEMYHYTSEENKKESATYLTDFIHSVDDAYTDFSKFDLKMERIQTIYARIDRVGDLVRLTDGKESFVIRKANFATLAVDRTEGTVTKASDADLIAGRDVFVLSYHGLPFEIFVYID